VNSSAGSILAMGGGSTFDSAVAIVCLMVYVASFAISLGAIFWLLNAEIYPLGVRKAVCVGHPGRLPSAGRPAHTVRVAPRKLR
jgi:Sugar (and other) transporter